MKASVFFLAAAVMSLFGGAAAPSPSSVPGAQQCITIERTLAQGSTGLDVSKLQKFLGIQATGYFGAATRQKLLAWQLKNGVMKSAKADGAGATGPKTRLALKCATLSTATTTQGFLPAPPRKEAPAASSTLVATSSIESTSSPIENKSSAGGAAVPPPQSTGCRPLGPKPTGACTTGTWQTVQDEGDCNVWGCSTPTDQG